MSDKINLMVPDVLKESPNLKKVYSQKQGRYIWIKKVSVVVLNGIQVGEQWEELKQ